MQNNHNAREQANIIRRKETIKKVKAGKTFKIFATFVR